MEKKIQTTQQFLVIGDPIEHSLSPDLYGAGFAEINMKATFGKERVTVKSLDDFFSHLRNKEELQGLAITAPLKNGAAKLVDELVGTTAQSLQRINTLWKEGNMLMGTNTDVDGIQKVLSQKLIPNARVLILGAGDTAQSILYALDPYELDITVTNRTAEKTLDLVEKFTVKTAEWEMIEKFTPPDILISSLPYGCEPQFSDEWIEKIKTIFCVSYGKELPPLLKQGKRLHCNIVTGGDFLLAQWEKQFFLLTGQKAPVSAARKILMKHTPLQETL